MCEWFSAKSASVSYFLRSMKTSKKIFSEENPEIFFINGVHMQFYQLLVPDLEILKLVESLYSKKSRLNEGVKFAFSDNHWQNTLRLIQEIEKCKFLMGSLMANFVYFLALLPNYYFSEGDWALDHVYTQFRSSLVISSFSKI